MDFVVILVFIAMVLSPCVIALRGRARPGAEQDEAGEVAEAIVTKAEPRRKLGMMFTAEGPIARSVKRIENALAVSRAHRDAELEPLQENYVAEPAVVPLEDLLREVIESAHIARAASLRADAAARGAAARIAAIRAEEAAVQARQAHLDADAAEDAAYAAHAAYETARAQAEEPKPAIRLVSERRAA